MCHLGDIQLPSPLPFEGVKLFPRAETTSSRYASVIDPGEILKAAMDELEEQPEQLKILLLALIAGLRRSEIDTLQWSQVDFDRCLISISETPYFRPKSPDSAGEVEVDREFLQVLQRYYEKAEGPFVIESDRRVLLNQTHSGTRCQQHFESLYTWLRAKGVNDSKPLHTLRKEFGSLICQSAGVYAASRLLRHADIRVTAEHYLDKKDRVTVPFSSLLQAKTERERSEE